MKYSFDKSGDAAGRMAALLGGAAVIGALAACSSDEESSQWIPSKADSGVDVSSAAGSAGSSAGGSAGADAATELPAKDAAHDSQDEPVEGEDAKPDAPLPTPVFKSLVERCKLISNRNIDDPTPNDTHHRANLRGTDLGIPVHHGTDLFVFFGDSAGAQVIWPLGVESLPDAVGYSEVPYSDVAADPSQLCTSLRFLLTGGKSGSVQGDFAGASMQPPSGHAIGEYIHNPAGPHGQSMFPTLPGDFEVPSGAFSYGGSIYVFYTIINQNPFEMRGSYLAKWDNPSTGGKPDYHVLYHVDERFDANGPMRGDFVNIAALVVGEHVYMYGTGQYRASPVHLARKLLSNLETEGGFESYDAASGTWVAANAPAEPIVALPNMGELSVQYYPSIGRYVMLDQEINLGNRIAARFAEKPEGPWSDGVTVATMSDPLFALKYCCVNEDCLGERLFNCDRAGFYGTYMLPDLSLNPDGSFAITFFMSTWDPYNVALMTATFGD